MTAGIPGAGIGSLFYILGALWMLFREGWETLRGRSTPARRALVRRQAAVAAGIVVLMGGAAWLMETVLASSPWFPPAQERPHVVTFSALAVGLGTLTAVWLGVHVVRVFVGREKPQ